MSDSILVTGATGTLGNQVVEQLSQRGYKVRAAVHSPERATSLNGRANEIVSLDFSRPETFERALDGIDKVFFLSPPTEDMVETGTRFAESAKEAGVRRIVRQSGMGADADPGITLGHWHRGVERAIEDTGMEWTHLRPNSFMQNFVAFMSQTIKEQGTFYLPWGDGNISLVDVRDIATVAVESLTGDGHEGQSYEITGPEALSGEDCSRIFSEVLNRTVQYVDVPEDAARQSMQGMGIPDWYVDVIMELYAINKAGYTAEVKDTVARVTGKDPRHFEQFVQDYVEVFS
ncbi:MAG: SDR family oxidoreductase [Deltaproteobacteria bacterium]|nr:SDR family oxidoreductase [Deltaproteobacteria bacterium]